MTEIVPAILSKTEEEYTKDIERYNQSSSFEGGWIHIDFMDNKFVQNQSIDPEIVKKHPIKLSLEAHLMVEHPLDWIDPLAEAHFKRVIFHLESEDKIEDIIEAIKAKNMEVGIAIKLETNIEKLEPFIGQIDLVLLMSVEPGFQGQVFHSEVFEKIKELKAKNWKVRIAIDGAVRDDNVKELVDSGVDQLTIGSFLLKGDIEENVEKIWDAISL